MKSKVFQILLIEDNSLDARLIEEYLSDLEGRDYQIIHASTLHEGLSSIVSQRFDLIISDLGLPDSQGIDTYRAIYDLKPQCPILILSGIEDEEVAKGALREGAQDYITKNRMNSDILQKAIDYSIERANYFNLIKKSQEQFKVAVEGSNDGIWDWEIKTNKVYLSPQWKRMMGYEDHELKNEFKTFESLLHPDDKERVMKYVYDYLNGKIEEYNIDFRFRHKKGHYLWIMARGAALKNKNGELYRMAGSHTDITERVKFKEQIEEQNAFLHNIIESISFPFFVVNIQTFEIELINSAASSNLLDKRTKCYEMLFRGGNKCPKFDNKCPINKIIETKKEVIFEQERKDEHGHSEFIEVHAFPLFNSKGEVTKMIEYDIDITQRKLEHIELEKYRKHLEEEIQERTKQLKHANNELLSLNEELDSNNEELRSINDKLNIEIQQRKIATEKIRYQALLLENVSDAIISYNEEYIIQSWNKIAEELFGIQKEDAINKKIYTVLNIEHLNTTKRLIYKDIAELGYWKGEEKIFLGTSKNLFLLVTISAVYNDQKERIGFISVYKDITQIKKYQERLKKSLKKERELNELKSGFVSLTSHQFRTPLTTIQSSIELLELYNEKNTTQDKSKINKHLCRINDELKRINQTMDDVLLLGKLEAGKTPFKPEKTDLVKFCQSIIHQHYLTEKETREVMFNYFGEPYDVQIDQKLMHHIITNLLSNAFKYSKGNPHLSINFEENNFKITVKDNGIGIPEEDKKNLFQSFFRASNTIGIQGTGLGLVIVKQFIELHGGTITFCSKENEGTEFILSCPVI